MSSQSEVGHAKNVANLEDLISYCLGYGAAYNPSAANIKIAALQTLLASAKAAITNTTNTFTAHKNATNAREIGFESLRKQATRIINALDACGATEQTVKDARTFNNKMRGGAKRKKTPLPTTEDPSVPDSGSGGRTHSTSQQSFDSLLQHLAGLIQLLSTEPLYVPNENELKVSGLNAYLAGLQAKNTVCINAYTAYSNARITRDQLLYADRTGLTDIAQEVKKYIKSLYGTTSMQFKEISGLKFSHRKI